VTLTVEEQAAATFPTDNAHRDVVMILGYTSWAGAERRGRVHAEDRLTLELIDSERVGRLLVCNPYRSLPAKLLRKVFAADDAAFPASETRRLHEPLRARRTDPVSPAAIDRSCAAYERGVQQAAAELGLQRPAVITTHPPIAGFGKFEWAGPVTYYANDDLTAFPPLRPWLPAFEAAFDRMRSQRRRAVALSQRSLQSIAPSGPSAIIPCGLEPGEWIEPRPSPRWFLELPQPRMLYVGTLDSRIDLDAVRAVADAWPQGTVALVGPGAQNPRFAELRAFPNITVRSSVPREDLIGLVTAADVGLIPHVRSEQTEAMSPLKLYEYLAAGTPVAAIDLQGIDRVCPERTALASTGAEMAEAARRALDRGRWNEASRLAFIAQNSWSRRFERLLDIALAA
jgi:teichuronic acid biosynthesis glycosyltransferase TuaH